MTHTISLHFPQSFAVASDRVIIVDVVLHGSGTEIENVTDNIGALYCIIFSVLSQFLTIFGVWRWWLYSYIYMLLIVDILLQILLPHISLYLRRGALANGKVISL